MSRFFVSPFPLENLVFKGKPCTIPTDKVSYVRNPDLTLACVMVGDLTLVLFWNGLVLGLRFM
jgi:hypothetical protein